MNKVTCQKKIQETIENIKYLMEHHSEGIKPLVNAIVAEAKKQELKMKEVSDRKEIKEIREIIKQLGKNDNDQIKPLTMTIIAEARRDGLSDRKGRRLLREYEGIHWKSRSFTPVRGGPPTTEYKLIKKKA